MGGDTPRRTYKNPPIVEAVCTFSFASDSHWNVTVPGRFYELVRDEYPEEPEERSVMQASINTIPEARVEQVSLGSTGSRVAFRNKSQVLTIAPRNLGIHALAPYEGWESFRRRCLDALRSYGEVVGEAEISGLGLRYVNRIILPETTVNLSDYFTIVQGLPGEGFPGQLTSFFDRMEVNYTDAPVKIAFTWASDDQVADQAAFIMDFDLQRRGEIRNADVASFLDDLRERQRVAFESLIQDKLREVFDASR
ncbi:TIGR04255 family protein [Streptomyces sp. NPDC093970]|uniref:TIGR04255 family protein n=1 Tax=Streptomyces sp. NPDC093970 TaxID=3155076 RepID=UPI003422AE01